MKLCCNHEGCTSTNYKCKGYCDKHYQQFKKYGKTFDNTRWNFNKIIVKSNYLELVLTNRNNEEIGRAKIDKEDLEKVQVVNRWSLDKDGYVISTLKNKRIAMHRLLIDVPDDCDIDHKKVGIKYRLDNRKKNLRIATRSENNYNKDKQSNNTSGYKGVFWNTNKQRWTSRINIAKKTHHLGHFIVKEDAIKAYKKAATAMQGDFYYE